MYEVKLPHVAVSMRRKKMPLIMLIHTLFGFILSHYINIPMCFDVYPYFLYLIRYMQKFYIIYIRPQNLYVWHTKVTTRTCILYDTPCHLVIILYLVYFTVGFGNPPQDVDIWLISGSSVFCLLLVMPLSMSSNVFVNGARMSGVCAFITGYFEYEHKMLLIHWPVKNLFFSHQLHVVICGIVCITIK